ncbi:MAG: ubiquinone biosynthesis protein UbiE [Lachnospiraceae bacterium]|nr:ubiquinone biosynthesis protein UbiE [Lachnospiraceae bacterium]
MNLQQNNQEKFTPVKNMEDIEEYFFTGYCKTKNQSNIFTCEYSVQSCGLCLEQIIGCDFLKCEHNKDCTVVKQALNKEDE